MAGHAAKFADRLLANTQQATPIIPKNKRTIIRDAQIQTTTNPMQDCNFGMFRGQRSTVGNGLSGARSDSRVGMDDFLARPPTEVSHGFSQKPIELPEDLCQP